MKLFPPTRSARIFLVYAGAFVLVLALMVLVFVVVGGRMTGNA